MEFLSETLPPQERHCFDFFGPKSEVSRWFDIVVGERLIPHAAWVLTGLEDRVALSWQPGTIDRWLEEDVQVFGHPRDPFHRVDALPSSRHVTASANGVVLADTRNPVVLFETDLPTRYYFPAGDVNTDVLVPAAITSVCPYKGTADRYWDVAGQVDLTGAVWSYSSPFAAVGEIRNRLAFYNELVDITVDGIAQKRPASPFSKKEQRPA
ncbi:uncharacterized protein (DUF427 family) [Cryobacterium sp. CG_9.6]|nr:uncharacterized protein (DUF427 family) [Cryobacterium sp. CG_9.6]